MKFCSVNEPFDPSELSEPSETIPNETQESGGPFVLAKLILQTSVIIAKIMSSIIIETVKPKPRSGGMTQEDIDRVEVSAKAVSTTLEEVKEVYEATSSTTSTAIQAVNDLSQTIAQSTESYASASSSVRTTVMSIQETINKGEDLNAELALARAQITLLSNEMKDKEAELLQNSMECSLLKSTLNEHRDVCNALEQSIQKVKSEYLAEIKKYKKQICELEKLLGEREEQVRFFKAAINTLLPVDTGSQPQVNLAR